MPTPKIEIKPEAPLPPQVKPYHLYATDDSPLECIHLGGLDFPKRTEIVEHDEGSGTTRRTTQRGIIKHLHPDDLGAIEQHSETKFFRGNRLMSKLSRFYRPQRGDRPAENFVRMKELSEDDVLRMMPQTRVVSSQSDADRSERLARKEAQDASVRKIAKIAKATGQKLV